MWQSPWLVLSSPQVLAQSRARDALGTEVSPGWFCHTWDHPWAKCLWGPQHSERPTAVPHSLGKFLRSQFFLALQRVSGINLHFSGILKLLCGFLDICMDFSVEFWNEKTWRGPNLQLKSEVSNQNTHPTCKEETQMALATSVWDCLLCNIITEGWLMQLYSKYVISNGNNLNRPLEFPK